MINSSAHLLSIAARRVDNSNFSLFAAGGDAFSQVTTHYGSRLAGQSPSFPPRPHRLGPVAHKASTYLCTESPSLPREHAVVIHCCIGGRLRRGSWVGGVLGRFG